MNAPFQHGFTVVELMLFLGVTGALFAALMIGVNMNIAQQRYRESVFTFSTDLQNQYNEVDNTRIDRNDDWTCENGDIEEDITSGTARGTTDCVLLGRAVEILDNGETVRTLSVVGIEPSDATSVSDLETLASYFPKVSTFSETSERLDWLSKLVTPEGQDSSLSMLVLRSPVSGLLRVFVSTESMPDNLRDMITSNNATNPVTVCVDGDSGSLPTHAIRIDPKIASQDGITIEENIESCQD